MSERGRETEGVCGVCEKAPLTPIGFFCLGVFLFFWGLGGSTQGLLYPSWGVQGKTGCH